MSDETVKNELFLPFGFDEQYTNKDHWPYAAVKVPGRGYIPIHFVGLWTAAQTEMISPFFTEPGLILVSEVTVEKMQECVEALPQHSWSDFMYAFTEKEVMACTREEDWPPKPPL